MPPIDLDEVRQWGRVNGWSVEDGGRLPAGLRKAYDERENGSNAPTDFGDADAEVVIERPPSIPKTSPVEKARGLLSRTAKNAPRKSSVRSRTRKPRVSIDKLVSWAWQGLAQAVAPVNTPVARVLDAQAPVAGMILEDVVKDTVVDRVLQPLARVSEGGEVALALLAPPLLVGAITARPDLQVVLIPALKGALRTWIDVAGPKLEEVRLREKEYQEKYGASIDEMLAYFFADVNVPASDGD